MLSPCLTGIQTFCFIDFPDQVKRNMLGERCGGLSAEESLQKQVNEPEWRQVSLSNTVKKCQSPQAKQYKKTCRKIRRLNIYIFLVGLLVLKKISF